MTDKVWGFTVCYSENFNEFCQMAAEILQFLRCQPYAVLDF